MKAIIMAGGEGSRLRPLTCDCPKPMLPLLGKPLMEYAVRLLKQHGVTEIAVTLGYLSDAVIDYFGDGSNFGVSLHYYIEKVPLGTAGSVKQAENFLTERFIVLSGDGITDYDLRAAMDFHQKNDAHATLLLKQCGNPQEYGMVVTDSMGCIQSFHEKPGSCDVFSDRINTGVYILEPEILQRISANTPCDFGHDLFPALLKEGAALYGHTMPGYWCDVGDVPAYLRVHMDALDGKIRLPGLPDRPFVSSEGAILESGCKIDPPCFIGKGSRIAAGAHIGPYAVIGENCRINAAASIKRSVLFDHVQLQCGSQLRGCIAGSNTQVGEHAHLFEDSAVGSRSRIGARAVLAPGVKLWPDKALPDGEHPDSNIVWGSCRQRRFIGGRLELESPVHAARASQACVAEMKPREILLGRENSTVSGAAWHAAAAGILSQGIRLIDGGESTLPQLRHTQHTLGADAAMMVTSEALIPLNINGSLLPEKVQRSILKLCERQDFTSPSALTRPMESAGRTDIAYAAHAASVFRADPLLTPKVVLFSQSPLLLKLAEQAFERAGLQIRCECDARNMQLLPDETGVYFSEDGQQAVFADHNGRLDDARRQMLIAWTALEMGEPRLILHNSATRAIDILTAQRNAHTLHMPGEYPIWMNSLAEKSPLQFNLQFDGVYSALASLSMLAEKGRSVSQWLREMPPVYQKSAAIPIPSSECGRILHVVAEEAVQAELGGGIRIMENDRWAWLCPDERASGLQITAEAVSMETAEDMCDSLIKKLRSLLKN